VLARITAEIDAQRVLLRSRAGRAVAGGLAALALLTTTTPTTTDDAGLVA